MRFSVVTPLWQDRPPSETLELAATADRLGFPEPWVGEMATYDAFALATAIGLVGAGPDIHRRLEAYRAAGADEVCLVPATAGDPGGQHTLEAMRSYLPGSPKPDAP